MTTDDQEQNERLFLLQRLTSQKDSLLKATQEIEDLINQSGSKQEVWKRLYLIIAVLSELISYSNADNKFLITFITGLYTWETAGLLNSTQLRLWLMFANSVQLRWDIKKGPIVTFKDMSIFKSLFGGIPG